MKIPTLNLFPALLAAMLLSAGCSTTSTVVTGGAEDIRIEYNDPVTQKRVEVVDVTQSREDNLLRAVVTLRNRTKRNLRIQYRFRWYGEDGVQLMPANDVYLTRLLEGGETASVRSLAPTPQAATFRFQVSKAHVLERGPDSF